MSETPSVNRVKQYVEENSIDVIIKILAPESTRTSDLAAGALGSTVAEIGKTIGFREKERFQNAVLVVLSGDKKVSLKKLAPELGAHPDSISKMTAEEMKILTGYSIGGIPPFPHHPEIRVVVDISLFRFQKVWAAAGAANAVMSIDPNYLVNHLKLARADVSE